MPTTPASPAGSVRLLPTARLPEALHAGARALMDTAFTDFDDHDWEHALGGMHAVLGEGAGGDGAMDETVIAHGSLVMRRMLVGGRSLRCGYVEAVAVHPDHRRRGLGNAVMSELESLASGYDLLALGATDEGRALYLQRGWTPWRGPTSVLGPHGAEPTPDDDGHVLVLGGRHLDLDAPISCDWRDGDVW